MATYYISPTGNDSNDGLSTGTAWQTVSKITSGSFSPGDSILLQKVPGHRYGHFTIPNSGSDGNRIIIGSYGSGDQPECYASILASGWNDEGGNIHSFQNGAMLQDPKSVVYDGVFKPRGRSNYFTITAANAEGVGSYVDATGLPAIDYTGTQIVIRNNQYIFRAWDITSKVGDRINYSSDLTGLSAYTPIVGYGFFIQNHMSLLTEDGDWMYDSATNTFYMYFADDDPNSHDVDVAAYDHVIDASEQDHIEIIDIACFGSISHGIDRSETSYVYTNGCEIAFCGDDGINNSDFVSSYALDTYNVIHDCHSTGIYANYNCHHMEANYNQIYNCGLYAGASLLYGNSDSRGSGIIIQLGTGNKANHNKVHDIGANGISVNGNSFEINDNIITQFCKLKGDSAGIYCSLGGTGFQLTVAGSVKRNMVMFGTGNAEGTNEVNPLLFGIYMDDEQNLVNIDDENLVAYINGAAIYLHNNDSISVQYNTLFGNNRALNLSQDGGHTLRNITFKFNKIYQNDPNQFIVSCFSSPSSDVSLFGDFNNNDYKYVENHIGLFEFYDGDKYNYGLSFNEWKTVIDGEASSTCEAFQSYLPNVYTPAATLWTQTYPSDGSQSGSSPGQFSLFSGGTRTWSGGNAVLTKTLSGKRDAYMAIGAIAASTKYVFNIQLSSAAQQFLSLIPESSFSSEIKRKRIQAPSSPTSYKLLFDDLNADASDQMLWLMESDFVSVNADNVSLEQLTDFTFESDIELIYNSGTSPEEFTFDFNMKNLETGIVALSFTLDPSEFAVLQKTAEPITPVAGTVIYVYAKLTIV